MEEDQRKKLVGEIKTLQKLTRSLGTLATRIGKQTDTVSWRRTLNSEVKKGVDLVASLQNVSSRLRADSMTDAKDDKLLQQANPVIQKFNEIKDKIDSQLVQHEPVADSNPFGDDGNAYGDDNAGYQPPSQFHSQQQQDQIEQIGLVSLGADIDHLEEQNKSVTKIAEDITELKEAFTDLNVLVSEQGEMIDQIVETTTVAKEEVQTGTAHLETAEKHQMAARKKQLIILIICILIVGVIFGLMGGFGVFDGNK